MTYPLRGELHFLEEGTEQLPDFEGRKPVGEVCMSELALARTQFDQDFLAWIEDLSGLPLTFILICMLPWPALITSPLSDDGSKVFINDKLLINNDGIHGPRKIGQLSLDKGFHRLNVQYFQGPRFAIALELFWIAPEILTKSQSQRKILY